MKLYPHQRVAVDFLKKHKRCCLADDMGLGKTISAAVAAYELGVWDVLVVAPSVALWNWQRELKKWMRCDPRDEPFVLHASHALKDLPTAGPVITSHALIRKPAVAAALGSNEVMIVDESHMFRTRTAQQTRALYGTLVPEAKRVWCMTGTPAPNDASELWTMLRHLHPDFELMPFRAFRARYCQLKPTRYGDGWKVVGNQNVRELKDRIGDFILRRKKTDVLDLPPKRVEVVTVQPEEMPPGLVELERKLRRRAVTESNVQAHDDVLSATTPEEAFRAMREHEDLARFRRLCGHAKVAPAVELVRQELRAGLDSIVLAAHHTEVIDGLRDGLSEFGVVVVQGSTSTKDRQAAVEAFQNGSAKVFIGQLQAAGTAITLTRASESLFVELSYTPGDNAQFADRVHRIGQTRPVRVRFLSLAHSVDEIIVDVVRRKVAMIQELMT